MTPSCNFDKGFENVVYNCDCLDLMRAMAEGGVKCDWCITDPPYGIAYAEKAHKKSGKVNSRNSKAANHVYSDSGEWDNQRLTKEYFDLIFQVSKNQIIFGGNYYTDYLPPTKSWVVWDKRLDNNLRLDFADCELAWASKDVARVFRYYYNGFLQGDNKNKDKRFHVSQKPTQLFIPLINYYTKPNDLIFDPFMGSFTTAVCCHKTGRRYLGAEINKDYFDKGTARLNELKMQYSMFD